MRETESAPEAGEGTATVTPPQPPLTLSVAEAAAALGVSDDLVYELAQRGVLPCLRVGRRKLIPRRAIEIAVESAIAAFDPAAFLAHLAAVQRPESGVNGAERS